MLTALVLLAAAAKPPTDNLAQGFQNPPLSARPRTWWHWMNGNVTKAGITADLEAMKQIGIGGGQAFGVDQGIPHGPANYGGPLWQEMTTWAAKESKRLGLDFVIHNGAGWSSSGGPWITPANAMQVIAWSKVDVHGPSHYEDQLPQPKAPRVEEHVPFYRDIAVYAYPTPTGGDSEPKIDGDFLARTGVIRGDDLKLDLRVQGPPAIPAKDLVMLTAKMDSTGKLTWDVPDGDWTILRMGYTPVGVHNHPAPPEGDGLEVDKLSRSALDTHWNALVGKVIKDVGPLAGTTFNGVLIDSYEVGTQNWSPNFRNEFKRRRGYDPMPYLPVIAGRTVNSSADSERFLWDLRRTVADLFADNYYGYFAELCHRYGLKSFTEVYGSGGFDTLESGSKADVPMGEFWLGGGAMETTKLAASVGHTYGRPIVGAESFTGDDVRGRFLEEPYQLKALGDRAFCEGINRYIFHRYAMQPWLDFKPGMTMGPWGTHLERTQTWWTEAAAWMKYIQRCQFLLQAGQFQADVLYYYGEDSPHDTHFEGGLNPKMPKGFDYDVCDAAILKQAVVRNNRVVLPSGMTYRVLVLPDSKFMRPAVARKVRDLVLAGATVMGPKPVASPSLEGQPQADQEVQGIGDQLWGQDLPTTNVHWHSGGNLINGIGLDQLLYRMQVGPDFEFAPHNASTNLIYIHRKIGDADVYFVSNQRNYPAKASCIFRVDGKAPELWHPETGNIEDAVAYSAVQGRTQLNLRFGPAESVFVVFRHPMPKHHLLAFGDALPAAPPVKQSVVIEKARYGSADGRGVDVTDKVRQMVADGESEIGATNTNFGDPVVNVVKQLTVTYRLNGKEVDQTVPENDSLTLLEVHKPRIEPPAYTARKVGPRAIEVTAWKPVALGESGSHGRSILAFGGGVKSLDLSTNWALSFPPNLGAPKSAWFSKLDSWTDNSVFGIKYFSGTATYSKSFNVPSSFLGSGRALMLDLGLVKNFATVYLNGKKLDVLWKQPFCLDVSSAVRAGSNSLQIKVTNLWVNRLIGDDFLPPDVQWQDGHLAKWPEWLLKGQPRPKTGRVTFVTWHFWNTKSPLLESGMMGPVTLKSTKRVIWHY